jgi:hypothetical protein
VPTQFGDERCRIGRVGQADDPPGSRLEQRWWWIGPHNNQDVDRWPWHSGAPYPRSPGVWVGCADT